MLPDHPFHCWRFPEKTPEESDGFSRPHENRPDSHILVRFIHHFLLPFPLLFPLIPDQFLPVTPWFKAGLRHSCQKGENVAQR